MPYILHHCNICKTGFATKEQAEEHEKIPLDGYDLSPGNIFRLTDINGRPIDSGDCHILLITNRLVNMDHITDYEFESFVPEREGYEEEILNYSLSDIPKRRRINFLIRNRYIYEFTPKTFSLIEKKLKTEFEHSKTDRDLGKKYSAFQDRKLLYPDMEITRGIFNRFPDSSSI